MKDTSDEHCICVSRTCIVLWLRCSALHSPADLALGGTRLVWFKLTAFATGGLRKLVLTADSRALDADYTLRTTCSLRWRLS